MLDDEVKLVRGFRGIRMFPESTLRRALVTLWRMSWFELMDNASFNDESTVKLLKMSGPVFWKLFQEQNVLVQYCLQIILIGLGVMVKERLEPDPGLSVWALAVSVRHSLKEPQTQKTYAKLARDIDASVLMTLMIFGVKRVFGMRGDWQDHASRYLNICLDGLELAASRGQEYSNPDLDVYIQIALRLDVKMNFLEDYDHVLLTQAMEGVLHAESRRLRHQIPD